MTEVDKALLEAIRTVAESQHKSNEALLDLLKATIDKVKVLEGRIDMLLEMYLADKKGVH